ncbi:hypothetical protein Ciccas_010146 [Cichlidogyrus casuarinus]|uniref:Uncharacterized protein n=1 Tax=Cichlidogyrus casuarinus TaxID=1844966 RepID=A0ABD2PWJ1_9PLAT
MQKSVKIAEVTKVISVQSSIVIFTQLKETKRKYKGYDVSLLHYLYMISQREECLELRNALDQVKVVVAARGLDVSALMAEIADYLKECKEYKKVLEEQLLSEEAKEQMKECASYSVEKLEEFLEHLKHQITLVEDISKELSELVKVFIKHFGENSDAAAAYQGINDCLKTLLLFHEQVHFVTNDKVSFLNDQLILFHQKFKLIMEELNTKTTASNLVISTRAKVEVERVSNHS